MNQGRISRVIGDQLINQIIHQGKAMGSVFATNTYSRSLSVNGCKLRPVPGSRDNNSTNPKGRAFRSGAPVKGSQFELIRMHQSTDSISAAALQGSTNEYLTRRRD